MHEEMWLTDRVQHELYQIWVNLPGASKMCQPRIQMLAGYEEKHNGSEKNDSTVDSSNIGSMHSSSLGAMNVVHTSTGASVALVCGSYCEDDSAAAASRIETDAEDVRIFHIRVPASKRSKKNKQLTTPFSQASTNSFSIIDTVYDAFKSFQKQDEDTDTITSSEPNTEDEPSFSISLPDSHTCLLYVREGAASVQQATSGDNQFTDLPMHSMVRFASKSLTSTTKSVVKIFPQAGSEEELDLLLLAGKPSGERVVAQGAMVMNSDAEVSKAYGDYQVGKFGIPWDHKLSDGEWQQHVQRTKPRS